MRDFCLFASSGEFHISEYVEFFKVIMDLSSDLNITLNHMDYVISEGDTSITPEDKTFNPNNLSQLNQLLRDRPLYCVNLWSERERAEDIQYRELDAEFVDNNWDNNPYICIHFPLTHVEQWSENRLTSFTNDLLHKLNLIGKLETAFVTVMDSNLPSTYFRGILTEGLSEVEAINLIAWNAKYTERNKLLRNLYWGNLLNSYQLSHLSSKKEFLECLRTANCYTTSINNDDLFFMFPSLDFNSQPADRIYFLLEDSGLLLQADDEARREAKFLHSLH